jgi:hypothetical protein
MAIIWVGTGSFFAYIGPVQDYIDRVVAADVAAGNTLGLEVGVRDSYDVFIRDSLDTGDLGSSGGVISQANSIIKAAPILAGARTLAGALVPLVGPAPTNIGFASGDYNRKTGLLGNPTSKSLNSNRNNNADPQNSSHNAVWVTTAATGTAVYIGVGPGTNENGSNNIGASGIIFCRNRSSANGGGGSSTNTGFIGTSRSTSANFSFRLNSATSQVNVASQTPYDGNVFVFSTSNSAFRANGRMSFYSIGEALDLALLETRLATLMASLSAAIP